MFESSNSLTGTVSPTNEQSHTQLNLQRKASFDCCNFPCVGLWCNEVDGPPQMRNRLVKGRASDGNFACRFPQVDGTVSKPSCLSVYGQYFWGDVGVCIHHCQDSCVDGASLLLQLAFIGGVAHQRVLEQVGRFRRQTAAVDQFRVDEPIERGGKLGF